MIVPISGVYSNNVSISCHFFDTTAFRVYVTACRAPNLEKSAIFGKQLQLEGKYSLESTDPRESEIRAHLRP